MKTDSIEIKGIYQGYLWYSDSEKPETYDGTLELTKELTKKTTDNPFIIEGHLYKDNPMESISIKFIDGEYHIHKYEKIPASDDKCTVRDRKFISHRMDGKVLCFKEVWRTEEDDLCEGFEVLKPCELIFVGFEKNE